MTAWEIVETALGLLRTGYAFPGIAERAAAAIKVRLAAGEYDGMNKAAPADLLTSHPNEICADKALGVRTMRSRAARPEPGEPAGQQPAPRERLWRPHLTLCRPPLAPQTACSMVAATAAAVS